MKCGACGSRDVSETTLGNYGCQSCGHVWTPWEVEEKEDQLQSLPLDIYLRKTGTL